MASGDSEEDKKLKTELLRLRVEERRQAMEKRSLRDLPSKKSPLDNLGHKFLNKLINRLLTKLVKSLVK